MGEWLELEIAMVNGFVSIKRLTQFSYANFTV